MSLYLILIATISGIAFCIYLLDKLFAKMGTWRVPELWLLSVAIAGGAAGALLAMTLFRHKTRHKKFTILVPIALVVQIVVFAVILFD